MTDLINLKVLKKQIGAPIDRLIGLSVCWIDSFSKASEDQLMTQRLSSTDACVQRQAETFKGLFCKCILHNRLTHSSHCVQFKITFGINNTLFLCE